MHRRILISVSCRVGSSILFCVTVPCRVIFEPRQPFRVASPPSCKDREEYDVGKREEEEEAEETEEVEEGMVMMAEASRSTRRRKRTRMRGRKRKRKRRRRQRRKKIT